MSEKPILFSTDMVRAILDGRKTQTRRVVKFLHTGFHGLTGQVMAHQEYKACYSMPKGGFVFWSSACGQAYSDRAYRDDTGGYKCPYGAPGDLLWVRETWGGAGTIYYKASGDMPDWLAKAGYKWRPSIFMPRWASRITLRITDVRVERLEEITEEDAIAEGCKSVDKFKILWDNINQARGYSWLSNPWVWVISFEQYPREDGE
jgi:hypothetical protein